MGYYDHPNLYFNSPGMLHIGNSLQDAMNELSRNNLKAIPVLNQDQVAGTITSNLPESFLSEGNGQSHTWQANPSDTLGHALRMMEILEIPVISLGGMATAGHYYLMRERL